MLLFVVSLRNLAYVLHSQHISIQTSHILSVQQLYVAKGYYIGQLLYSYRVSLKLICEKYKVGVSASGYSRLDNSK